MPITVVAVGRLKSGPELDLCNRYLTRMTRGVTLREVEERKPLPAAELKKREGDLILAAVPDGSQLIALDEHGKSLTSRKLASLVTGAETDGDELTFVIGGADGLSEAVLKKAAQTVSFGAQTWPHMLARAMLLEQLYRAQQIASGHPYHRD